MNQTPSIQIKTILAGMIIMFILVHLGFYATYIRHFPEFDGFSWVHHLHGSLMASWVFLLVLQPMLIYRKQIRAHRILGRLSYILAPLILVSMVLVARLNFHHGIVDSSPVEVFARQSITWMQILLFLLFYTQAIYHRKQTDQHLRFMVATAILMTGPAMGRIIGVYFGGGSFPYNVVLPLVIKTTVAAALLLSDLIKHKNWKPYAIVFAAFAFADIVYYARFSEAWQGFGKGVTWLFY